MPPREYRAKAKEAARKAVELDPNSAVAQIAFANVAKSFDYNLEEAERACLLALQLDPSNADAHTLYGDILNYYERNEEAEAAHRRSLELDPLSMPNSMRFGFFLGSVKKDDEVVALMKRTMDLDPKLPTPHFLLSRLYMAKGMHAESVEEYATVGDIIGHKDSPNKLRQAFAQEGWEGFLRAELERLHNGQKTHYVRATDIAIFYMQLGDKDKTLEFLEQAFYNREPMMLGIRRNRLFENLRADLRFTDLVRRIEGK
jgi:tetratricopeptide (TPR) repeat protein